MFNLTYYEERLRQAANTGQIISITGGTGFFAFGYLEDFKKVNATTHWPALIAIWPEKYPILTQTRKPYVIEQKFYLGNRTTTDLPKYLDICFDYARAFINALNDDNEYMRVVNINKPIEATMIPKGQDVSNSVWITFDIEIELIGEPANPGPA